MQDGQEIVIAIDIPDGPLGTTPRWMSVLDVECDEDGAWSISATEVRDDELFQMPLGVLSGTTLRWRAVTGAGVPDREAIAEFAEGIVPLAVEIAAHRTIEFGDAEMEGSLDDVGGAASERLEDALVALVWMRADITVMDALEWAGDDLGAAMDDVGFGDGPSDGDGRAALEARIDAIARDNDFVLLRTDRLVEAMENAKAEAAEGLSAPGP